MIKSLYHLSITRTIGLLTSVHFVTKPYLGFQMQAETTQLIGVGIVLLNLIESENLRKESKISVPERHEETLVAQTPGQEYLNKKIEINHTPEIKGGLKALQQRGMKITHYEEHIPK